VIREARADARRADQVLAHAEGLLNGSKKVEGKNLTARFPRLPVRRVDLSHTSSDILHERPDFLEIRTGGELRQGEPIDEKKIETVLIPSALIEKGEIVLRIRGDKLKDHGIEDGDLVIAQLRPKGKAATGELAIGKIGSNVFVGRWWQKNGRKALLSEGMAEVTVGKAKSALKIVAVINAVVRIDE